ncbi:MAG: Holliday junction ATP-dependent DNA helicase RuvA [Candidatus Poribacteria bacterium]|nr:Holliday junction ATP-dependent DNA helicase RuvA [Candidatus Poribacteria bacterium]
MISFVKGILAVKDSKQAVVDVKGVGYSVDIPASAKDNLPEVGSEIILYTHHYHRDNEEKLYGFTSKDERIVFEISLTVKGIGPALALNIVAKLSPAEFQRAVRDADLTTLMRVPRLNKETAQLIIIKLKNTIRKIQFDATVDEGGIQRYTEGGTRVLVGLGASELAAEQAMAEAQKILGPTAKLEDLIRLALSRLNKVSSFDG